jgi:hypothetical protein
MDWTVWLIVFMLLVNALLVIFALLRKPAQSHVILHSDVEQWLQTAKRLTAEERDLARRALTGMPASRYWFLLALLGEIEEGRRSADLLRLEAYRYESDESLAS